MKLMYFTFMILISSSSVAGLPPKHLPNINEVEEYINGNAINYNNILSEIHYRFERTEYYGLFGYNWYGGIILADLDKDGVYELYLNASIGSGFIHNFIHGYNPITDMYYILSKRMETDYILFIYKEDLYIFANNGVYSKKNSRIEVFKPLLKNHELTLENIDEKIYNEIIESDILENIYNPFNEFVEDNILK